MSFRGELGLQFTIHIAHRYTVPELVRLAGLAHSEGFQQIWVNDNLRYRNLFVVLAAMAASVPIKLGTAILVPYFRNPVDVAGSLLALSELTGGRELSVGIARGDLAQAGHQIEMTKPMAMVSETTRVLQRLLAGESVSFRDYPVPGTYHRLNPELEFRLAAMPQGPVRFYCGGNGPRILRIAGELMDGVLIGGFFIPLVRTHRLKPLLDVARQAAANSFEKKRLVDACEINVSVSRNKAQAFEFAKGYVAHALLVLEMMGFSEEEFTHIGIETESIARLRRAYAGGATVEDAAKLVPDRAVASCFVAGGPEECAEQLRPLFEEADRLQFSQIVLSKLGPDYDEAIQLLSGEVLPRIL